MRRVVSNHEVPHLWAHQTQSDAKNAGGSFYFTGDTIYSYGSHFPIARHISMPNGEPAVLVTSRTYGITTTGHTSRVHSAIPRSVPQWFVERPDHSPADNFAAFEATYRELLNLVVDAKNKVSRAKRFLKLEEHVEYVNRFAVAFELENRLTLPELAGVRAEVEAIRAREEAAAIEREERRRIEYAERERTLRLELADAMIEWRAGFNVHGREYRFPDTLLRIEGGELVTSRGARFPVSHAVRALRIVERVRATGTPYKRNGHTIHLGHYPLDSIDVEGNVCAGCHCVQWAEIERIAPMLRALAVDSEVNA